jgi:hypothetical protein
MNMSLTALRSRSLFFILTLASRLSANPLVGSAQDAKIDTVKPDQTNLGAQ